MLQSNDKKSDIRNRMLQRRAALPSSFLEETENTCSRRLFALLEDKKGDVGGLSVMSYVSFKNEFPTRRINADILSRCKGLVLPRTDGEWNIHALRFDGAGGMAFSAFGIEEPDPASCEEVDKSSIDVILLPGVAFDRGGGRLGFGKGCYDRFLRGISPHTLLIGLSYGFQVCEALPCEGHDVPCNMLFTEAGIIECDSGGIGSLD